MTIDQNPETLRSLTKHLKPLQISEIVLRTSNYEKLRNWYEAVLGVAPFLERQPEQGGERGTSKASDLRLCFIRLHMNYPYTQILAIFDVPGLVQGEAEAGLHHMQFRHASLEQLISRYELLESAGIKPVRTANHGPGTSFYYRDPDGNNVELSASNFEIEKDYLAYIASETFKKNPSGMEIDVVDYVQRFRSGTPQNELVAMPV